MIALPHHTHTMPKMRTDLGSLIATERTRLGWTQRDVAERSKVRSITHVTIGNIERGRTLQPDQMTLWGIAEAFAMESLTVGEWFTRLSKAAGYQIDQSHDAVLARLANQLSEQNRARIMRMTPAQLNRLISLLSSALDDLDAPEAPDQS